MGYVKNVDCIKWTLTNVCVDNDAFKLNFVTVICG